MAHHIYTTLIIGTGFSGLAMAIKLKEKGINDFLILEKANAVGGTWRENTYPGAECDIPSALYSYSFEPYPHWEYKWSMQPQILTYINHVVDKYELDPFIQYNKEMVSATWMEDKNIWEVRTKNEVSYLCKTLVSAIGQLHHPSTPNFKGIDTFTGVQFHSAQWDHSISLKGKKVGVIGNAASAVQFIPEIAKEAGSLTVFQRSANWMIPKLDRAYKDWEKALVRKAPFILKLYRQSLWMKGGLLFFVMKKGNGWLRKILEGQTKKFIKENINDPLIVEKLIPKYPLGAKRVLFSDTYYPALARPNVQLINAGVQSIVSSGVKTKDGATYDLDILIYATGFKTNPFLLNLDIKGKAGITIQEHWKDGPSNYLGITVNKFPNLFIMYGPNTNLGHNSIILMSEAQANYIAQCVEGIQSEKFEAIEIKKEVIESYHKEIQNRLKNMIWSSIENSWYLSENGNQPNNYPGRTMEYARRTKKVNFEDYMLT